MTVEEQRQRVLAWEGCFNARDLGGYPTADGGRTAWGAVVRTDNLAPLTEVGRRALLAYGIRAIVDLRRPEEVEEHPNPFADPGTHGIAYTNISLIDPAAAPSPEFTTLANDYKGLLDRFQYEVAAIMTAIAEAPDGGVLVHCMAGKDRTGIVSALLLDLVGVPRQIVGEDYALTAECFREHDLEWLENGPGERAWRERELARFRPRPEVMIEVLEHLDARYGGVEAYLLSAGVAPRSVERLRRRLVTSRIA